MLNAYHGRTEFSVERHGATYTFAVSYCWHRGYWHGPGDRFWMPAEVQIKDAHVEGVPICSSWAVVADRWFMDRLNQDWFREYVCEKCFVDAAMRME